MTVVLGMARSGTTWLAKIFDSHPDVFYSHEPDLISRTMALPALTEDLLNRREVANARDAILSQIAARTVKSGCSLPVFRKSSDSQARFMCRAGGVLAIKALHRAAPGRIRHFVTLPAWLDQPSARCHTVMKTVSGVGRANLLAEAMPEARFVFVIRDALGQVASRLYGLRNGFLNSEPPSHILRIAHAKAYGLTESLYAAMTLAERLAWEWTLANEKAMLDIGASHRTRVIRYDDLVADPIGRSRDLLAFAGLNWAPSVETFIKRSSSFGGRDRYYSVRKNDRTDDRDWTKYLTADEQKQIRAIMRDTLIGRLWPDI